MSDIELYEYEAMFNEIEQEWENWASQIEQSEWWRAQDENSR